MRSPRLARRFAVLLVSLVVFVSCVGHGATPAVPDASMPIAATATAAVVAMTSTPSVDVPPTEPLSAEAPLPEPPAASIAVEGGDPVVGELGSFTWNNGGSASPGLDGSPIHVGTGEPVTVTLAAPVAIASWQVSRVLPGNHDGVGAISMAEGSGPPVAFQAPSAGTWSVEVRIGFAGNLGSAAYYWRMEVD